jgi:iron complex transport system ATP-binding protein
MLHARRVRVTAGSTVLLDDVSIAVAPGEVVALVGPNGAGKSTLLRVLAGDLRPGSGEVVLNGRPLEAWTVMERARQRAVLPQHASLTFPLTVLEVVLLGRTPHLAGVEDAHDVEIAHGALDVVGLRVAATRLYPSLSGGERQGAQLARVAAQVWEAPPAGARFLLLDEPVASLDLVHQHATLTLVRAFAHGGAGVVVVLHDLNLAAQYADRLVVLGHGRVVADARPRDALTPGLIAGVFGVHALVVPHPALDCPLVVPVPDPATGAVHRHAACATGAAR